MPEPPSEQKERPGPEASTFRRICGIYINLIQPRS